LPKKEVIAMQTILDRFERIVIPKKIRQDFDLKAGTQMQIEENEKSIILTPIHGEPNLHMKDGVLVFSGAPLEDLGEALVKHREERLKTIRKTNESIGISLLYLFAG
jgi:AbrB family looped-hinge helix DNA binding protein